MCTSCLFMISISHSTTTLCIISVAHCPTYASCALSSVYYVLPRGFGWREVAARIPNGDSIEKSPTPLPEWRMEAARGDGTSHWTPRHIKTGNTRSYRRYRELLPARICVHMAPVAPTSGEKSRTGRPDRVRTGGMSGGQGPDSPLSVLLSGRTGRQTGGLSGPCPVGQGAVLTF